MLEDDLRALAGKDPATSLDGLEKDIWRNVESHARSARAANAIAVWQVAVIAVVLVTGVAGGSIASHAQFRTSSPLDAFSPGIDLAPSTRLLGNHP